MIEFASYDSRRKQIVYPARAKIHVTVRGAIHVGIIIRGINPRGVFQPRFPRVESSFSGLCAVELCRLKRGRWIVKSTERVFRIHISPKTEEWTVDGAVFSRALNLRRRGGEN